MAVHLEVTTENLLNAVAQMPESEFNYFVKKARELRRNSVKKSAAAPAEAALIDKINTIYSAEKRQRYNRLYEKFQQDKITPKEYKDLSKLSDEFEILNAERLEYLSDLAKLRGKSFEETVKEFKVKI